MALCCLRSLPLAPCTDGTPRSLANVHDFDQTAQCTDQVHTYKLPLMVLATDQLCWGCCYCTQRHVLISSLLQLWPSNVPSLYAPASVLPSVAPLHVHGFRECSCRTKLTMRAMLLARLACSMRSPGSWHHGPSCCMFLARSLTSECTR